MSDPPESIGSYRLVRLIGRGSFGSVYLAESADGRQVSLKVAPAEDETYLAAEVEATRKVSHPGVVRVLEHFVLNDVGSVLVSEYVDGKPLTELVPQVSMDDALVVAERLASILCAAHQADVIHRDIKPANIIVPFRDEQPIWNESKLADFGVAGKLRQDTRTTGAGEMFGSLAYMAPEQLTGAEQSPATDVYGLGALLFEMVYQRPLREGSLPEVLLDIRRGSIRFPKQASVPDSLRQLIAELLEPDPARRPRDGCEALRRIQATLRGVTPFDPRNTLGTPERNDPRSTVTAHRPSPAPPAPSATAGERSNASRWVTLIVAVLVIVTLIGAAWWQGWTLHVPSSQWVDLLSGVILICAGVAGGFAVRHFLKARQTTMEREADRLLSGAKSSSASLNDTFRIHVDQLIAKCKEIDERILGATIALMLTEYNSSATSADRQMALMNAVQIVEKLMTKLSPWYVRKKDLLAFVTGSIGGALGLIQIASAVAQMRK